MAIELSTDLASGRPKITFSIEADDSGEDFGVVSLVGSFNDWTPGLHELTPREDGRLALVITVADEDDLYFRYLRTGGIWFDDEDADEINQFGSVIYAARLRQGAESGSDPSQPTPEAPSGPDDSPASNGPLNPA